jgi:hypothetical protein
MPTYAYKRRNDGRHWRNHRRDPRREFGQAYRACLAHWQWLLEALREREMQEDFLQSVSVGICAADFGMKAMRNALDRAMYQLARENGFVRPSAGLTRGQTGRWTRLENELQRRNYA